MKTHLFTQSSMMNSCEHDPETNEITIVFHNGKRYTYCDFTEDHFNDFLGAESAGKHFAKIKAAHKLKED